MAASTRHRFLCCSAALLLSLLPISLSTDTISANQNLSDGDTILSSGGDFELGFFTTGSNPTKSTTNRYLGIWYKKISTSTVVWVANREYPVHDSTGLLRLNRDGTLTLLSSTNGRIWSSNTSRSVSNPVGQILDTGNFVIRDENDQNPDNYIWQSFDYPGDTALPGMKFGKDLITGLERRLTPWTTANDPSPGEYTALIDTIGYPQYVMTKGSVIRFRPGPWNGLRFSGQPGMKPDNLYTFDFVMNEKEIYYTYQLVDTSVYMRNVISPSGSIDLSYWIDRTQNWSLYNSTYTDSCDRYGLCGPYGRCDVNSSPACGCLDKFEPTLSQQWSVADWSLGCKRKVDLDCGSGEGFIKYSGLKLPDTESSWFDPDMDLEECEKRCKGSCTCTAYSNLDIRGHGSGCLLWFGNLTDIRTYTDNGQDLYIRMAASELPPKDKSSSGNKQATTIVIAVLSILPVILLGLGLFYLFKRRRRRLHRQREEGPTNQDFGHDLRQDCSIQSQKEDLELPFFTLSMLLKATNNFSINNKLGEGGFGPVYKGELKGGQVIAVKRLSEFSSQGLPSSFQMDNSYGTPASNMFQSLLSSENQPQPHQQPNYNSYNPSSYGNMNSSAGDQLSSSSWSKFPQFLRNSSPPKVPQPANNQLHFSINAPFWNATAAPMNDSRSSFFPSLQMELPPSSNFDDKPLKQNTSEGVKKSSSESSNKRPRNDNPPSLPAFKVRKEKLGNKITALQQLVSPFGKTNTASVLSEAIEYIKFLHEQVSVLSTPYMKNGAPVVQHQQMLDKSSEGPKQDLRSRGLCLVPVSSTFPVTHETPVDFWTPSFRGTFR